MQACDVLLWGGNRPSFGASNRSSRGALKACWALQGQGGAVFDVVVPDCILTHSL